MKFFTHSLNRGALKIALASFIIGNLLFLLSLFLPNDMLFAFGLVFLIAFIGVHAVLFMTLLINLLMNLKHYEEHLLTMVLVYLNVPLALLYINFL